MKIHRNVHLPSVHSSVGALFFTIFKNDKKSRLSLAPVALRINAKFFTKAHEALLGQSCHPALQSFLLSRLRLQPG